MEDWSDEDITAETASRSETNSTPIDRLPRRENIPCVFSALERGIKRQEVQLLPTEHADCEARGS